MALTYWIIRISSGRSDDLAEAPASMNSSTMPAPSCSALRRVASRWAGIENPSSVPPFWVCSRVETRRYDTAAAIVLGGSIRLDLHKLAEVLIRLTLQETGESRAARAATRVPDTYRAQTDDLAASEAAR